MSTTAFVTFIVLGEGFEEFLLVLLGVVGDVAEVIRTHRQREVITRFDGVEAVERVEDGDRLHGRKAVGGPPHPPALALDGVALVAERSPATIADQAQRAAELGQAVGRIEPVEEHTAMLTEYRGLVEADSSRRPVDQARTCWVLV